ncbi:MAG: phage/plasmid primase, P4 family [Ruminococcus sp.]
MRIEELLGYFHGVKTLSDNHYLVKCPCHNDHKPSLDIAVKADKILMACPVCGANGKQVMGTLGLNVKDLFLAPISTPTKNKPQSVDYIYSDTLKKSRFYMWDNKKQEYKKGFCWWNKVGNKWQKGLPKDKNGRSVSIPLYNQKCLAAVNNGQVVYIVEGEKDVDTLKEKLHLLAVCSPHGAGKGNLSNKWRKEYNKLFQGLDVAIVPDNDTTGKTLAHYIAKEILLYAKSIKIINLSDEWNNLKEKGDITDIYESEKPFPNKTIAEIVKDKLQALLCITEPFKADNIDNFTPKIQNQRESDTICAPIWAYKDKYEHWKIDERLYITEFAKVQGVKCINGTLYNLNGEISDDRAKQIIIKEILNFHDKDHGNKAEKLLKGIKQFTYTEPPQPDINKIHFNNGTLSKDNSGLFTVWSNEKEFCINRINCDYNPNAPEPKLFSEYLSDVYQDDDMKTLQQYCGYCLLPTTALQQSLVIIGNGGEGKSVLGAILNGVIGERNCFNESVATLSNHFGIANIENKLLFIDDDLSEKALTNARAFKNLVTNKTTISAEKKFQQKNEIKSYVRFLCFGNFTLQSLYDVSEGFIRRQLVLIAKPKDINRIDNPFIDKQIIEQEGEGVVNWLIRGLNDLIKNNFKIYVSERTKGESDRIKKESDTVKLFLDECDYIEFAPNLEAHTKKLFDVYEIFCSKNALPTVKLCGFAQRLNAAANEKT